MVLRFSVSSSLNAASVSYVEERDKGSSKDRYAILPPVLLGHKRLDTTTLCAQVATDLLREVISPLETLHPA
jgi:hypothetical protein